MEHRWGQRATVDIPVRLSVLLYAIRAGRILNLSVSGAWLRSDFELPVCAQLDVAFGSTQASEQWSVPIPAYVVRTFRTDIGIEWCDFSPAQVRELLLAAVQRAPSSRCRAPAADLQEFAHRAALP
jgi:hypothetical protein